MRLARGIDGQLWLEQGATRVAVEVVRCFPWSASQRFLSLRDASGAEAGFIEDTDALDPASRAAVHATLARSGFVLEITKVLAVQEDFELRSFRVETAQGPRLFQTPLDAWPQRLDGGAILVEDVFGDLYRVSQPNLLDAHSRHLLWPLVD